MVTRMTHDFGGSQTTFTLLGLDKNSMYHIETGLCTNGGCGPVAESNFGCEQCGGRLGNSLFVINVSHGIVALLKFDQTRQPNTPVERENQKL